MNNGRRLVETARRLARARLQQQREAVTLNAAAASVSSLRARQDGADLRLALDHPSSASSSSSAASTSTGGLFGYRQLRGPHSLSSLAQSTIRRAQLIVTKITSADVVTTASSSSAEERFLRVVKDLDRLSDTLCRVIDLAEFVRNAHPDERWQDGANEAYETLCEYMNLLNTHTGLYHALKSVHSSLPPGAANSSSDLFAACAVATPFIRDFEKSGIHLPESQRRRFVDLSSTIIQLGRAFLQNAAGEDNGDEMSYGEGQRQHVRLDFDIVARGIGHEFASGLPRDRHSVLVDPASWHAHMLARRHPASAVRREMWLAINRAPKAHVDVLDDLLATRAELASLVGRDSWAQVQLEDKMAQSPESVMAFLETLERSNRPLVERELGQLAKLKAVHEGGGASSSIEPWDRDFYTDVAAFSHHTLPDVSPFFSVGTCVQGLSTLFDRLYGIHFVLEQAAPGELWDPTVVRLGVYDDDDGRIGTMYADLFARPGKAPGAAHYTVQCSRRLDDDDADADFVAGAMDAREYETLEERPVRLKSREGLWQEPVIVLSCAFARAEPALLQWHELETLVHETGHAMHSMVGRTHYHNVSGTRCATDFVELPSVIMEHFVAAPDVLALFARHHKTGHPLPPELIAPLVQSGRAFAGIEAATQLTMSALDQAYHSPLARDRSAFDSTAILADVSARFSPFKQAAPRASWQTTFGHLFGYGASYYSYLFDRAIAARIFRQRFSQDVLNRDAGDAFKRDVLSWGGGKDPWEMVGAMLKNDTVARGGEQAMREVGRWGIHDA